MSYKNNNNEEKDNQNYYLSVGIGLAFGVLFNNIAIGAGLSIICMILILLVPKIIDYLW